MSYHFEYISKHDEKVQSAYQNLIVIIKQVQKELKNKFTFQFKIVGSYSQNMMTYDIKSNKGFDFDVNIYPNDENEEFSAKQIKTMIINAINKFAGEFGYSPAVNSTRVIKIAVRDKKHQKVKHSVDFAIVNDYVDDEGYDCQEYIRYNKKSDQYEWQEQDDGYYQQYEKVDWIKNERLWTELRKMFLYLKNNNDKSSRSLYAEAINNICNEYGYYD